MLERDKESRGPKTAAKQVDNEISHDIGFHLEQIHGKKAEIDDPHLKKLELLRKLRKLLKKL